MDKQLSLSRRAFLRLSATSGAGLLFTLMVEGCRGQSSGPAVSPTAPRLPPTGTPEGPDTLQPSAFIRLGRDGSVTLTVARSEMGQGVRTALAMILAEELGADWSTVHVEQAWADPSFGDQLTGGSESMQESYLLLRRAGASVRELLLAAAGEDLGVDPGECQTDSGSIVHTPSGRRLPFSELLATASRLPLPKDPQLNQDVTSFRVIGQPLERVDARLMVDGQATYGMDVRLAGMLYASVERSPVLGGKVRNYNKAPALEVPGVRHVMAIESGIAVVAENTWAALRGREALQVEWENGAQPLPDSEAIESAFLKRAQAGAASEAGNLVSVYTVSFLAHAALEPMNCVADVRSDACEIWVPTQNPFGVQQNAARRAGLLTDKVKVNVTLLGGGFGRRLEFGLGGSLPRSADYVADAVEVSKAIGSPVLLVWNRADDFRNDLFHPLSVTRVSALVDGFHMPSLSKQESRGDVPVGNWRSVTNVAEAFARECFLDELAEAKSMDPIELRRNLLDTSDMRLIDAVASKADWGTPLPKGRGRGIAFHSTWGRTPVAEVVEVEVTPDGRVHVRRVICAVDCGLVINPDIVSAQIEGGVIFGLSAALNKPITFREGRVQETSFAEYPLLTFEQAPEIEVHILSSGDRPTGIGEMGNPPAAPALLNAIYAATGRRLRKIPIPANVLLEG